MTNDEKEPWYKVATEQNALYQERLEAWRAQQRQVKFFPTVKDRIKDSEPAPNDFNSDEPRPLHKTSGEEPP
jgi:hypothetical protein